LYVEEYSCPLIPDYVSVGKIRYKKNIKNLPPGAMYSSACCPALPRGKKSDGQLEKTYRIGRGLKTG
jgi:hypothetical protein